MTNGRIFIANEDDLPRLWASFGVCLYVAKFEGHEVEVKFNSVPWVRSGARGSE